MKISLWLIHGECGEWRPTACTWAPRMLELAAEEAPRRLLLDLQQQWKALGGPTAVLLLQLLVISKLDHARIVPQSLLPTLPQKTSHLYFSSGVGLWERCGIERHVLESWTEHELIHRFWWISFRSLCTTIDISSCNLRWSGVRKDTRAHIIFKLNQRAHSMYFKKVYWDKKWAQMQINKNGPRKDIKHMILNNIIIMFWLSGCF